MSKHALVGLLLLLSAGLSVAQGIPVTDPLIIEKCSRCHERDAQGLMERISWERATPEGWQESLKKMLVDNRVTLTPTEARAIVKYLSDTQGLTPEEAFPIQYYSERRIHDENEFAESNGVEPCAKCHPLARPLLWRRSETDWKSLTDTHAKAYKVQNVNAALAFLTRNASFESEAWRKWNSGRTPIDLSGRWLVVADLPGYGRYTGEVVLKQGAARDQFVSAATMRAIDGSTLGRSGVVELFGGFQWRGRSRGDPQPAAAPGDPRSEARESMWIAPDGQRAKGRWFWGQYQEFGFDVELMRASGDAALLAVDRQSLKRGTRDKLQLIGDHFPPHVSPADLRLGQGIHVREILSATETVITAEVDVAPDAPLGRHDVSLLNSQLKNAVAVYDRVDYIKVTPESSVASFGSARDGRGYQQFEAVAFQRGPDGKAHTADDLQLGPVRATWSMEVFYAVNSDQNDRVGSVTSSGLFVPAAESAGVNHDLWVIATARDEVGKDGQPLVGKGYVVVSVPEYTFNGRRYVRDLDRWIEEGAW
jgi:quinohemoprotein amine dehydrogenase